MPPVEWCLDQEHGPRIVIPERGWRFKRPLFPWQRAELVRETLDPCFDLRISLRDGVKKLILPLRERLRIRTRLGLPQQK